MSMKHVIGSAAAIILVAAGAIAQTQPSGSGMSGMDHSNMSGMNHGKMSGMNQGSAGAAPAPVAGSDKSTSAAVTQAPPVPDSNALGSGQARAGTDKPTRTARADRN